MRGSGLILILLVITLLMAFAAVLGTTTMQGMRAAHTSEQGMRSFYMADSGAQAGIARLRASGGGIGDTSFSEEIDQGTASVAIVNEGQDLFQISSTGTWQGQSLTVEVYLQFSDSFSLPAAFTATVANGTAIKAGTMRVQSFGTSVISGMDHDASGALMQDQSDAAYALAMNKVPGKKTFGLEYDTQGTSTVEGVPSALTNNASSQASVLKGIRDNARTASDVAIVGSTMLGEADTGSYGTAASPKLVYARLRAGESIHMTSSFTGYGTLVIDIDKADADTILKMDGLTAWYGLVVVFLRDSAEVDQKALLDLSGNARIVGGLSMLFNAEKTEVTGKGQILRTTGNSEILYSKELLSSARGTETLGAREAKLTSYRIR